MCRLHLIVCISVVAFAILNVGAAVSSGSSAKAARETRNEKITICHATGNGGYVSITISVNGLNGHDGHDADIIPPHGTDPGRNWDPEGQATWENGCVPPEPPTPPTYPIGVFASTTCGDDGTYNATFGYTSDNHDPVSVPIGPDNLVAPGKQDQGQPTRFQPGTVSSAFTVTRIPGTVTGSWTVRYGDEARSVTVARPSTCGEPPHPPAPVTVTVSCVDKGESTYTARFGYSNPGLATVSVPTGPANGFSPVPVNRDQPIAFEPGADAAAVEVSGIPNGTTLAWTLKTAGKTSRATASDAFRTRCTDPLPPEPEPIAVFVTCVDAGPSTFTATFGYVNPNAAAATVPVGIGNRLSPAPEDRGQPTTFAPGRVDAAFTVSTVPNGTDLVWTVNGRTATASSSFTTGCSEAPPLPPTETDQPIGVFVDCVDLHGATYDATYGYQNDNRSAASIPVGSGNAFSPAPAGRGQVTQFQPGNVQAAFTVNGIPRGTALTWSVTYAGATRSATASNTFERRCSQPPVPPEPIGLFACVTPRGSSYDVTFGYVNENAVAVSIPVGLANGLLPAPLDRGQPTLFVPGSVPNAFTVKAVPAGQKVVWRVAHNGTKLLVVSAAHPARCGTPPPTPPVQIFPLCALKQGSTYVAAFGYLNSGSATIRVRRGAQNAVSPTALAGDQPEVFLPGLTAIAFAIPGVPLDQKVTWTLETAKVRDTATASSRLADCRTIDVGSPDLSVTKTATPRQVEVGGRVEYTIVVRNQGTSPAANVIVVDRQLTHGVEVATATTSQGKCQIRRNSRLGVRVICHLGTVGPDETVHILVAGRAVSSGSARDIVAVLSASGGGNPSNNVASAAVLIEPATVPRPSPPFTG
jgi:uncharacterized repeat protein (TIGR01451 family)